VAQINIFTNLDDKKYTGIIIMSTQQFTNYASLWHSVVHFATFVITNQTYGAYVMSTIC